MAFKLGRCSLLNLRGVHPDLVRVVKRAISIGYFTVIEGLRTPARQKELFARVRPRRCVRATFTDFAVDIAPYVAGSICWDWPLFDKIETAMKKAAHLENVSITWGVATGSRSKTARIGNSRTLNTQTQNDA